MVKYSADQSLIQGARDAATSYGTAGAMGLRSVTQAGQQLLQYAGEKIDEKLKKEEEERIKQEQKTERQRAAWDNAALEVSTKAGGLGTNVYEHTKGQLAELRDAYLKAIEEGDKNAEMDVFRALDAINLGIQDFKNFRNDATNENSENYYGAMSNSADENNGMEREIYTHIFSDQSEITTNEKGERVYSGVTENGHEYSMTEQQIMANYPMQNTDTVNKFTDLLINNGDARKNPVFNFQSTVTQMEKIIPKDTRKLRSFLADDITNENWAELLDKDSTILDEANAGIKAMFDTNDTPGLQEDELKALKDAMSDPFHPTWENPDQWASSVRPIVVNKLINTVQNQHIKHKAEIDKYIEENTKKDPEQTKYFIKGQYVEPRAAENFISFIQTPKEGQVIQGPQSNTSYMYKGGKFYTVDDEGKFTKIINAKSIAATNGFSAYVNLPETKTEKTNFIDFDPNKTQQTLNILPNQGDRDGDGIPDSIDPQPDKPN
tara:strand:- start:811 stop:2286 length:1476 start_codon:yes stop_codon:yes gene_type:complete